MRGVRRLVVCTAVSGLLAAGAVSMSLGVAHADSLATACEGNGANGYFCNLEYTIASPSSITVNVTTTSTNEEVDVNWTVTCQQGSGAPVPEEGATDYATTPLNVPLQPLPTNAVGGSCTVNAGISIPKGTPTGPIVYTGELNYTTASTSTSTSSASSVHPVKGYGGKCLDDKGNSSANGAAAIIWGCSSSDQAQNWSFSSNELKHNGKCLNDKANGGSGSKVILYSCNGGSNEKWSHLANGEFKLQAHNGALCLNDPAYSTKNGTQLIVYSCKGTSNEKWSLP
jgi:Ricin-type beta-trefoil lectin domain